MKGLEKSIGVAATKIAKDISANCIVSIEKNSKLEIEDTNSDKVEAKVIVFREVRKGVYSKAEYKQTIAKPNGGSVIPIKRLLAGAISRKYINNKEKVVCVINENLFSAYKGLLFVFDVDKLFFDISQMKLVDDINPDILEVTLNICMELIDGREGRKIGTAFIIGDYDEIKDHLKQLIINPFGGYEGSVRYITDSSVKETVKEFAQLDGVFIIDKKGVIKSAGTYIDIDTKDIDLPGLGTKHRSCISLTSKTNTLAIVLSESGNVKVIKSGKIVMTLP